MPQFDFSTFPSQIFWLAVCFTVLFVLLNKMVVPKVDDILTERQKRIDDDLSKAADLKAETEAAIAAYEQALADARAKAQAALKEVHEANLKAADERSREVGERLAAQIAEGEGRIIAAKTQALKDVSSIAAEVAQTAAEKIAGIKATKADVTKVVGAVMKERG